MFISSAILQVLLATVALGTDLTTGSVYNLKQPIVAAVQPAALSGSQPFNFSAAAAATTNENSAGLVLLGPSGTYQFVTAEFSVPGTHAPGNDSALYTAIPLLGIDLFNCDNFLVAGVQIHVENGIATYEPFYQWYPQLGLGFNVDVEANQEVQVTIEVTSATTGVVTISNNSNGQSARVDVAGPDFPLCLTTASWVVYGVTDVPLPDFGSVVFDEVSTTLTNGTVVGPTSPNGVVIDLARNGTVFAETSLGSESITVQYAQ